jgi:hypothetical protein
MQAIIVTGNPVDGFRFFGPFPTRDTAIMEFDRHNRRLDTWWVADLEEHS